MFELPLNAVPIYIFKPFCRKIVFGVMFIRVSGNFMEYFRSKNASNSSCLVLGLWRHATIGSREGAVSISNRTSMELKQSQSRSCRDLGLIVSISNRTSMELKQDRQYPSNLYMFVSISNRTSMELKRGSGEFSGDAGHPSSQFLIEPVWN